jgi:hypothetical protein
VEREALGVSRDYEATHAIPTNIRNTLQEKNAEQHHLLEDAAQNVPAILSQSQDHLEEPGSPDSLKGRKEV